MNATTSVFSPAKSKERTDDRRLGTFFWLLVLHFAVEYLRPQAIFPAIAPLRLPLMLTMLTALAWLAVADKRALKDSMIVLQLAFIALIAASVLWAVNQYWVFETFKVMTAYFLAGTLPVAALLITRRRLVAFFNCWIVMHVLLALWAITHEGRGTGSFLEDENDLSLALNMAIPYAYYLLQRPGQPTLRRLLYMAAVVMLAAGVVMSESRGGFLGLVAVALGIVFFSRHRLRNLLVIGVLGSIGLVAVSVDYIQEMQTIADTEDATRNDRLYSWRRGWEMFLDHPLVGVGASNYPWRVEEYEVRSLEYRPGERRLHGGRVAHSLYFTVIPEFGLTGIMLFFGMSWIMYRRLARLVRLEAKKPGAFGDAPDLPLLARAMTVSMFGLFVSGAFISVLFYPHFWLLIGFTIALCTASMALSEPRKSDVFAGRKGKSLPQ